MITCLNLKSILDFGLDLNNGSREKPGKCLAFLLLRKKADLTGDLSSFMGQKLKTKDTAIRSFGKRTLQSEGEIC